MYHMYQIHVIQILQVFFVTKDNSKTKIFNPPNTHNHI
jgi:hypothetical protein